MIQSVGSELGYAQGNGYFSCWIAFAGSCALAFLSNRQFSMVSWLYSPTALMFSVTRFKQLNTMLALQLPESGKLGCYYW